MKELLLRQEQAAFLLLNVLSPSRTKPIADRLLKGESALEILRELEEKHAEIVFEARKIFDAEKELNDCEEQNIELIFLTDKKYPFLLRIIPDPPLVLYVRGSLLESDHASVALVGARKSTHYGLMQARRFGAELANAGWTVVSGLAKGIDSSAHEGALSVAHGRTIAVLGCGVDVIYPAENRNLCNEIINKGAVISEFPLRTKPLAYHFPRRNRIISGLSLGTFVLEAFLRSGSLITAQQSIEQGREVFALPGRIDDLTSMGTHQLIKEGATMIDSFDTLNQELAVTFKKWQLQPFNQCRTQRNSEVALLPTPVVNISETKRLESIKPAESLLFNVAKKGCSFEEISTQAKISPSEVALELIQLELQKKITRKSDGLYYSLN